jgi:hypothetical protein
MDVPVSPGRSAVWLIGCGLALAVGCGQHSDLPPLAKVSGRVTLDGQPLPRGTVQFVPDASKGASGPAAVGTIGPDGRYELVTAGAPGAVIGWHQVRIRATEAPTPQSPDPPSILPARYNNAQTSALTAEVKAGEDNVVEYRLSSRP